MTVRDGDHLYHGQTREYLGRAECPPFGGLVRLGLPRRRDGVSVTWASRDEVVVGPAPSLHAVDEVAKLAEWIVDNVEGEPSESESAVDCAIRLLAKVHGPGPVAG